jgi:hypothetical protein
VSPNLDGPALAASRDRPRISRRFGVVTFFIARTIEIARNNKSQGLYTVRGRVLTRRPKSTISVAQSLTKEYRVAVFSLKLIQIRFSKE